MLVGGMPQSIETYLDTNNLSAVDAKKREIIELYLDDFQKIDPTGKAGRLLYYYTWPTDDRKHNYEIDFILAKGSKICPVEVKSSGYKTHASLDAFIKKFQDRILQNYLVYTKDVRKDGNIILIPTFLSMFL